MTKIENLKNKVINADCFDIFPNIPDKSIDMILCDLPYGTTQCKWDSILPLDKLWNEYNRVIKDNGCIALFASQPFTSALIMSNPKYFKYTWVWEKSKATGYLNAKKQPMRASEDVCIFYKKQCNYYPQMRDGEPYFKGTAYRPTDVYGQQTVTTVESKDGKRYPRNVVYFKTAESEGEVWHPTQKPVSILEYMIKTYTKEGELVLDNTAGVFSTAVACINTGREFIAIEKEKEYCLIGEDRIKMALKIKNSNANSNYDISLSGGPILHLNSLEFDKVDEFLNNNLSDEIEDLCLYDTATSQAHQIICDKNEMLNIIMYAANTEKSLIDFIGINKLTNDVVVGLEFTRGRISKPIYKAENGKLKEL